jgi:hypothetical protein
MLRARRDQPGGEQAGEGAERDGHDGDEEDEGEAGQC